MKPSTHRYVLPPVLLGIHAVLLLPLILSPTRLRPPHFPEFGEHPRPVHPTNTKYWDYGSRLYLQYSIPLGIIGIVGVYVSKQLAGNVPLPKDERRKRLAQMIEWGVLFGMGVIEEVWRWGLVRLLVSFEGGHGGFRGGEPFEDSLEKFWAGVSLEPPSLWEGLYLMGWMWSVVECLVCNFCFSSKTLVYCYYHQFSPSQASLASSYLVLTTAIVLMAWRTANYRQHPTAPSEFPKAKKNPTPHPPKLRGYASIFSSTSSGKEGEK